MNRFSKVAILVVFVVLAGVFASAYTVQTATFREGVGGYTGTVDTWWGDGSTHGSDTNLVFDWSGGASGLFYNPGIRFESAIDTVPNNAVITKAYMTLTRDSGYVGNDVTKAGQIIGAVNMASSSFTDSTTSLGTNLSNAATRVQNVYLGAPVWSGEDSRDVDVTAYVKAVHAGAQSNTGFVLAETNNRQTNIAFYSSEAGTEAYRPQLTIEYIVPDSQDRIIEVRGTADTIDTYVAQESATIHGADTTVYVGRNQPDGIAPKYGYGFLQFDVTAAVTDAVGPDWQKAFTMDEASLNTFINGNNGGVFSQDPALWVLSSDVDWTEAGANWTLMDGSNSYPAAWAGENFSPPPAGNVYLQESATTYGGVATDPNLMGLFEWDVTTTTMGFLTGSIENSGWLLYGSYSTSGGPTGFWSSEFSAWGGYAQPTLLIIGSVPEPATGMILGLAVLMVVRRRRG